MPSSASSVRNQIAEHDTTLIAIYLASMLDKAIVSFFNVQEIGPSAIIKTFPDIDLRSFGLLLVFESPVSRLEKDRTKTDQDRKFDGLIKTVTVVRSLVHHQSRTRQRPVLTGLNRFFHSVSLQLELEHSLLDFCIL